MFSSKAPAGSQQHTGVSAPGEGGCFWDREGFLGSRDSWGTGIPGEQGFLEKEQRFLGNRGSWRKNRDSWGAGTPGERTGNPGERAGIPGEQGFLENKDSCHLLSELPQVVWVGKETSRVFLGFLRAGLGQQGQTAQLVTGGDRRFQIQELAGLQKRDPGWEHRSSLQLLLPSGICGNGPRLSPLVLSPRSDCSRSMAEPPAPQTLRARRAFLINSS